MRLSTSVLPVSSVSVWAICSLSLTSRSATRRSSAPRSPAGVRGHGPVSNAVRAAVTARSTSSGPAWSTISTTLASNGLITSAWPPEPVVHDPSM
jgi:hypothetical protein